MSHPPTVKPIPPTNAPPAAIAGPRAPRYAVTAIASGAIVLGLSILSWWLLIDPEWGLLPVYGNTANAFIFWALFFVVCLGFNLECWGFHRLPQPLRGAVFALVVALLALAVTTGLALVWGRVDPSFAADRADGVGYFTGAIFVLFAFLTNVPSAGIFEHRPWVTLGLRQPWVGLIEIAVAAVASSVLYVVFAAPALAAWSTTTPLLTVNTVIGYFYSIVVCILIAANHLDNWPWNTLKRARFAVWLLGNIALGAVLFFGLRAVAGLLLGGDAVAGIADDGMNLFAAQLGVCWVLCSIFWSNCVGNLPTRHSAAVNRALRVLITFILGAATFAAYYHWFAAAILHEPAVAAGAAGNALGFMDWVILWLLLFVVGAQSWPVVRPAHPAP